MLYIKWLTESSNFAYDQGGVPVLKSQEYPDTLKAFDGIDLVEDAPAPAELADLATEVQQEAELMLTRPTSCVWWRLASTATRLWTTSWPTGTLHGTRPWMTAHRSKRSIVINQQGGPMSALLLVKGGLLHGIFRNRIRA